MVQLLILGGVVVVALIVLSVLLKIVGIAILVGSWIVAGYLAGHLVRGKGYGPIGNAALGLVGGIVGGIIFSLAGLGGIKDFWLVGYIIAGAIGGVILIFLVRLFHDKDFAR